MKGYLSRIAISIVATAVLSGCTTILEKMEWSPVEINENVVTLPGYKNGHFVFVFRKDANIKLSSTKRPETSIYNSIEAFASCSCTLTVRSVDKDGNIAVYGTLPSSRGPYRPGMTRAGKPITWNFQYQIVDPTLPIPAVNSELSVNIYAIQSNNPTYGTKEKLDEYVQSERLRQQGIASVHAANEAIRFAEIERKAEEDRKMQQAAREAAEAAEAAEKARLQAERSSVPTECDRVAGDPEDPDRVTDGVPYAELEATNEHIVICKRAAIQMPTQGRFPYLVARLFNARQSPTSKDRKEYNEYMRTAAELDYMVALETVAMAEWEEQWERFGEERGRYTTIQYFTNFKRASQNGSGLADSTLGSIEWTSALDEISAYELAKETHGYTEGYITGKYTMEKAVEYFTSATNRDHTPAFGYLAFAYRTGRGISQDDNKAFLLLEEGVTRGDTNSIIQLAEAYEKGLMGLTMDKEKSLELYRMAQIKVGYDLRRHKNGEIYNSWVSRGDIRNQVIGLGIVRLLSAGVTPDAATLTKKRWPRKAIGQLQAGSVVCDSLEEVVKLKEFADYHTGARMSTDSFFDKYGYNKKSSFKGCITYNADTFVSEIDFSTEPGYLEVARENSQKVYFVSEDLMIKR